MANVLARLRAFTQTRNGKIAAGGTAVGGVVGLALVRRHKAGSSSAADGGAAAGATSPSYLQTTGTSGANAGQLPTDNSSGGSISQGQLDQLLGGLQNATDALNGALGSGTIGGGVGTGGSTTPPGTDPGWANTVISVFTEVVGHPPTDPVGVKYYADRLASGAITVDQMRAEMTATTAKNRAAQGPSGSPVPTGNPPPAPAPPPAPVAAPPPTARTYVVAKGDTLSGIAQKVYGNASRWPQIYAANKGVIGPNSNLIKPGQRLVIP